MNKIHMIKRDVVSHLLALLCIILLSGVIVYREFSIGGVTAKSIAVLILMLVVCAIPSWATLRGIYLRREGG